MFVLTRRHTRSLHLINNCSKHQNKRRRSLSETVQKKVEKHRRHALTKHSRIHLININKCSKHQNKRRRSLSQTVQKKVKKHGRQLLMLPAVLLWLIYNAVILTWFYIKFMFRPKTSFYRDPNNMNYVKRVGWSDPVSLDDVKMVKNVYGMHRREEESTLCCNSRLAEPERLARMA